MIFIYALIDPDSYKIRYIGKSIRPKERLQNHLNDVSNCHRSHWLQSLKAQGKKPYIIILQELDNNEDWQSIEKKWIAYGKSAGWKLTNNTDGGDGVSGLPYETRKKMAQTWIGRKHSPETIAKLKIARSKRTTSDETRKKHSASMKGRQITWKDKIGQANRKITSEQAKEIQRKISDGQKVIDLSMQYGVHRTTISKIKKGVY